MPVTTGVVIVGASLGGLRMAENLRTAGYAGTITLVGAEPHKPYNRPPLSKDVLRSGSDPSESALARLTFSVRPSLSDVTWRLGVAATALDMTHKTLRLSDGSEITFDGLGIATGLTPRRLAFEGGQQDRHVVRTIDDAMRLRAALTPGARVLVAGAGFIGCEVAATAIQCGCTVTVIEPLAVPMERAIGAMLGSAIQAHHEAKGIRFQLGRKISGLVCKPDTPDTISAVTLDDGSEHACDVLVEATGSVCNTDWLSDCGIDLSNGVLTDNHMAVNATRDVVAAGDVARFPNPRYDAVARRIEHWVIPALTAKRAAQTLAATLMGGAHSADAFAPLPTFWSDQFDVRLQSVGMPGIADRSEVLEGSLANIGTSDQGVAVGYSRGDRLVGVITIGLPVARQTHYRTLLN